MYLMYSVFHLMVHGSSLALRPGASVGCLLMPAAAGDVGTHMAPYFGRRGVEWALGARSSRKVHGFVCEMASEYFHGISTLISFASENITNTLAHHVRSHLLSQDSLAGVS